MPTEPYASWRKRRGEKKTHLSDLAHVGASGIGRRQDCRKGNQGGEHLLSIHLERYVWFRGESPPLLVIIIYFFPNKRQLHVRRRDVSPRPTVDSPLQRLYYTFCVRKQGKGTGYLVSARARPTFPENSKQQSGRGSGSGSAGSAEIGGERRERRETTWESLPGLWGGRKGSDLIVLERSGLRDGIRALLDFLFSSSSSENGLKTCVLQW